MVKPALCKLPKRRYCYNYCCYIFRKRVREKEIPVLGLENVVRKGKKVYLKSKTHPGFGPCVFLDEILRQCMVYDQRPSICKRYNCVGGPNPRNMIEEARYSRKKRGYEV